MPTQSVKNKHTVKQAHKHTATTQTYPFCLTNERSSARFRFHVACLYTLSLPFFLAACCLLLLDFLRGLPRPAAALAAGATEKPALRCARNWETPRRQTKMPRAGRMDKKSELHPNGTCSSRAPRTFVPMLQFRLCSTLPWLLRLWLLWSRRLWLPPFE